MSSESQISQIRFSKHFQIYLNNTEDDESSQEEIFNFKQRLVSHRLNLLQNPVQKVKIEPEENNQFDFRPVQLQKAATLNKLVTLRSPFQNEEIITKSFEHKRARGPCK
ncbi:Hypothetical_protein [Hexamita inflata]|uniref:Hypothetical_protein n=1 Tax=Hexamita inflata TaxID=28002 RepID=A0AA86QMY3_9EUKA|nr:Hypothetical protein HINF_LOCUS44813 [Hexamita inflata]